MKPDEKNNKNLYSNLIEKDPKKFGGIPLFKDTRVPVYLLYTHLEAKYTLEEFADLYALDKNLVKKVYELDIDNKHPYQKQLNKPKNWKELFNDNRKIFLYNDKIQGYVLIDNSYKKTIFQIIKKEKSYPMVTVAKHNESEVYARLDNKPRQIPFFSV